MSQRAIKKSAFKEFRKRKQHIREALKDPHPVATVLLDEQNEILCIGMNRARLAEYAKERGWEKYEMKDFAVVI